MDGEERKEGAVQEEVEEWRESRSGKKRWWKIDMDRGARKKARWRVGRSCCGQTPAALS